MIDIIGKTINGNIVLDYRYADDNYKYVFWINGAEELGVSPVPHELLISMLDS